MQLQVLLSSVEALKYVAGLRLPAVKAFKVSSYLQRAQVHIDAWQATGRTLAQRHYGEDQQPLSPEDAVQFKAATDEVLASDVEVDTVKLLSYPADFKEESFIPLNMAILSEHFVDVTKPEATGVTKISRGKLIGAYMSLQQLGQQELPKAVGENLLFNLMTVRDLLNSFSERDGELTKQGDAKALEEYRSEEVEVNFYPININAFGDVEVAPALLVDAAWLITEE